MHADLYNIPDLGTPEYRVWARTIEASDLRFLWNRPRAVPIFNDDSMLKQRMDAVIWPSMSCLSIVGYEPTTARERFEVLSVLVNRGQALICNQYLDMSPRYWLVSKNEIEDGHLEWLKIATPMYRAAFSDGIPYAPAYGKEIEPPKDTAPVPLRDKPVAWIGFKVTDPSGNPVPNVHLDVLPPNSDTQKQATTDAKGTVDVLQLDSGNCKVTSPAKGQPLKNVLNIDGNAGKNAKEQQEPLGDGPFYLAKIDEYKVKTGDTLESIAEANSLTFRELAQFNWNTMNSDEINNHLRDDVGCTKKTEDGKNYVFDDSDEPGIILVPIPWEMQGGTHKVHNLKISRVHVPNVERAYFSIQLHDAKGDTLKNVEYVLIIGDPDNGDSIVTFEGKSSSGKIEHAIPADADRGLLQHWTKDRSEHPYQFILSEIKLNPKHEIDKISGKKALLSNLNYYAGNLDEAEDDEFFEALEMFKYDFDLLDADDSEIESNLENPSVKPQ